MHINPGADDERGLLWARGRGCQRRCQRCCPLDFRFRLGCHGARPFRILTLQPLADDRQHLDQPSSHFNIFPPHNALLSHYHLDLKLKIWIIFYLIN